MIGGGRQFAHQRARTAFRYLCRGTGRGRRRGAARDPARIFPRRQITLGQHLDHDAYPGDDENLAGGFLLTEGIIGRAADIRGFEAVAENVIRVDLDAGVEFDADRLQRNFYTTSSCGVCGKASLEALKVQSRFNIDDSGLRVAPDMLMRLSESLLERGLIVSGRASFEILQKALVAGCPLVVAIGAPSSLAIELAWEFDMTLVGFLRDGRFNIYTGPSRIE